MASLASRQLIGPWRIEHMELWDRDYVDLDGPAHITFDENRQGSFAFGAVEGWIDYRLETRDQRPWVEFSWDGFNDKDRSCGRGWGAINDDKLEGRFFFHQGDESSFIAMKAQPATMQHRVPTRVSLATIVEGIEFQNDETQSFLNKATGEVVMITDDQIAAADAGDESDLSDRDEDAIDLIGKIEDSDEYLRLPSRFDVDEYGMMQRFAHGLENANIRDSLLDTLRGRGAFRRFKDMSRALGVLEEWYRYRDAALEDIAIEWCESQGIAFTRTPDSAGNSRHR